MIGATGPVGSEIVRDMPARCDAVAALPAIFSASLLAAAHQGRTSRTWTGLVGSGHMALIEHRDAVEAGLRMQRPIHGIETFNLLRGGEYFFLPSLSALRRLGRSTDTCRPNSFATRI